MRLRLLAASVFVLVLSVAGSGLAQANHEPFAPAESATVHPGVMVFTEGGQCTSNFVFTGGSGLYLGMAAHCAGTGGATETNGCDAGSLPLGTPVEIDGASRPGTLVYSSWLAMQAAGETDPNACDFNDFALILIDPADHGRVNPSIPYWGGPQGTETNGTAVGEQVYTYGNSSLRLGLEPLSPKTGVSLGTSGGGWNHQVYTVTPGIPGDSGSAFLDATGKGLGILVTVQFLPLAGSNGVTDLNRALNYANAHPNALFGGGSLVNGDVPFNGDQIPPL